MDGKMGYTAKDKLLELVTFRLIALGELHLFARTIMIGWIRLGCLKFVFTILLRGKNAWR